MITVPVQTGGQANGAARQARHSRTVDIAARIPYGQWLLTFCAIGLALFGIYSFFEARYRKL
ncbi:DUF1206 domain-containing protein [Candidatus Frankia alpina]|uniref:DUF1206 domain-containing protein n=1 Tax=Candidatus Frankia alpina TaxID=2699483 RepID=UPI0019679651